MYFTEAGDDCGDGADLCSSVVGNVMGHDNLRCSGVDATHVWDRACFMDGIGIGLEAAFGGSLRSDRTTSTSSSLRVSLAQGSRVARSA